MSQSNKIFREILVIVLTILTIISIPFSVLLLPVYSFRFIVGYLAKIFRKDLGKLLTPRSNILTVEYSEMFKNRSRGTLYVMLTLNGRINLKTIQKRVLENAVNVNLRQSPERENELKNPELQQTITSWLGYHFWKWDTNFRIENHIKLYEGPGKVDLVSDEDILEIMKDLTVKPFTFGQSPWEFWLWNNARLKRDPEQSEKSIVILRVHHSLADGYSLLKLLLEDIAGEKILTSVIQPTATLSKSKKPNNNKSLLKIWWNSLLFIVKAPYQFISMTIHSYDFNDWHIPENKLSGRINAAMTEPIPVEVIKEIKRMYGTSFNTIIQSVFTGGLRNFMIEQHEKIPHALHCMSPLPMQGHPSKLRNHMTLVLLPLPVGIEDPADRVRFLDARFRKLQTSTVPLTVFYLIPMIGALPAWVVKIFARSLITTCLMTNFPAPFNQSKIFGFDVDDVMFAGGLLVGNIGLGMNSLSYNGGIRLAVGIDEGVLPNPHLLKSLIRKVEEELYILKEHEIV